MPAACAARLFILTRPIKFLICSVIIEIGVPVVDATGYVYHICHIIRISKRKSPFLTQVRVHDFTEKYKNKNIKETLCRNYCCRYYNNSPPFRCHFSTLQHQLSDLRIFEPIAQILFYSTLTINHRLITALKKKSFYEETWLPSFVIDQ